MLHINHRSKLHWGAKGTSKHFNNADQESKMGIGESIQNILHLFDLKQSSKGIS